MCRSFSSAEQKQFVSSVFYCYSLSWACIILILRCCDLGSDDIYIVTSPLAAARIQWNCTLKKTPEANLLQKATSKQEKGIIRNIIPRASACCLQRQVFFLSFQNNISAARQAPLTAHFLGMQCSRRQSWLLAPIILDLQIAGSKPYKH